MEILSEEELVARLDYRRPLSPPAEEKPSAWCVPFEYGANEKGTRISVPLARQIAAELNAAVAEAEKRDLAHALEQEKARSESFLSQLSGAHTQLLDERGKVAALEKRLRARAKRDARLDKRGR